MPALAGIRKPHNVMPAKAGIYTTTMKAFLPLAAALLIACACGPLSQTPQEKAAEAARIEAAVSDSLDAHSFTISVDRMHPRRGQSKALSSPYSLKVASGRVYSYLPYLGVAYNVPYGGGKALNFEADILEYREDRPRSDRRVITLSTDNGEDHLIYTLTVFVNGKADIDVRARNREGIGFSGEMELRD